MAPEVARLLDAPRVIHGGADRAEHAQRAPDQPMPPPMPRRIGRLPERVELRDDEIELPGEIPQHEQQHLLPRVVIGGHAAENRR